MNEELQDLIVGYNEAVDRYNLARLAYAFACDGFAVPPVASTMPKAGIERAERHRPAARSVQAVREFFEEIFDGAIVAQTQDPTYRAMQSAVLDLTRRFFQVSLTRMGISCRGMLD